MALARFHRPAEFRAPAPPPPAGEVVYLDFPAISTPSGGAGEPLPATPDPGSEGARAAPVAAPAGAAVSPVEAALPGAASALPAAGPALSAGYRDPRLYVDPRALVQPAPRAAPLHERMVNDARERVLSEPDSVAAQAARDLAKRQVTIMGRRVTVFGHHPGFITPDMNRASRGWKILPEDGRVWEQLEMIGDRVQFERDSILRARTRATRERVDAERRGNPR